MKLNKVTRDEVMARGKRKYTFVVSMVEEFVKSGNKYAEVDFTGEYASESNCATAIRKAIKTTKHPVRVFQARGKVYLENLAINE